MVGSQCSTHMITSWQESQQDSRLQLQVSAQCSGIHGLGLRASWIFWISLDFFEFWMLKMPRGFYSDANKSKQTGSKQLIKDGDVLDRFAVWITVSVFYCWCWLLGQVLILSNLYWCPFRQIVHKLAASMQSQMNNINLLYCIYSTWVM